MTTERAAKELDEPAGRRKREQRVEAEPADGRLLARHVPEQQPSEAPSVGHDELAPVVERQPDLPVAGRPLVRPVHGSGGELEGGVPGDAEAARHPEVEEGMGRRVEVEPELLAPPAGRAHPPAPKRFPRRARHAGIDDRIVRALDPPDPPSCRHRLREPPAPLDLGELRHGPERPRAAPLVRRRPRTGVTEVVTAVVTEAAPATNARYAVEVTQATMAGGSRRGARRRREDPPSGYGRLRRRRR